MATRPYRAFCQEGPNKGKPGPCPDASSKRQQRLARVKAKRQAKPADALAPKAPATKPAAPAKPAPTAAPQHEVRNALLLADRVASGDAGFPDVVRHVHELGARLNAGQLAAVARELGSKAPMKSKDDALKEIHDQIRARRTDKSRLHSESHAERGTPPMPDQTKNGGGAADSGPQGPATADGVEIFASGEHKGKLYTRPTLVKVAENFGRLSTGPRPLLTPTVVIGHEEQQPLLENTGIPAAGVPTRVWTEDRPCDVCGQSGKVEVEPGADAAAGGSATRTCPACQGTGERTYLLSDFGDMPQQIAELVKSRAYRKVSSELYDDFEDQGRHFGPALRRVALLGGELPQVKGLADVEVTMHAEAPAGATSAATFDAAALRKFCEGDAACAKCGAGDCGTGAAPATKPRPFSTRPRPRKKVTKHCQSGPNAGKPGPCPGSGTQSVTYHKPGQRSSTVTNAPPVQQTVHKRAGSQKPAQAVNRPVQAPPGVIKHRPHQTGGAVSEAAMGALGDAAKAVGAGARAVGRGLGAAGRAAGRGLAGLARRVVGRHAEMARAGDHAGLARRVRMAEMRAARGENRAPRRFSEGATHAAVKRAVRKFCQSGENAGKPGPCPSGDAGGRPAGGASPQPAPAPAKGPRPGKTTHVAATKQPGKIARAAKAVLGAAKKAGAAAAAGAKKAGGLAKTLAGKSSPGKIYGAYKAAKKAGAGTAAALGKGAVEAAKQGASIAVNHYTGGVNPSLYAQIAKKHGHVPAALGAAAYYGTHKVLKGLDLVFPGASGAAAGAVADAVATPTRTAAKLTGLVAGKQAGKALYRGARSVLRKVDKPLRKAERAVGGAAKAVYNRLFGPKASTTPHSERARRRMLRKMAEVYAECQAAHAGPNAPRKFSESDILAGLRAAAPHVGLAA